MSAEPSTVVRLIDRVGGIATDGQADLMDWLEGWLSAFRAGDYGRFKSMVLVIEDKNGDMATISQSISAMDNIRVIGLLHQCAHRKMDGKARIEDMAESGNG